MRLQVEVRRDDEDPLRRLARENGGLPLRHQASILLHLKIQEEVARLGLEEPEPAAEVA